MSHEHEKDGGIDPRFKLQSNRGDKLHDLQLLRDLAIINERTAQALGPLPPGGLPVMHKRKPNLLHAALPPEPADPVSSEEDSMKFSHIAVAASLALAACAPTNESARSEQGSTVPESRDDPMMPHKFRVNPNPKQRYEITLTIKDAPGAFESVSLSAAYKADCWYVIDSLAGALGQPDHSIELDFKKLNDTTYSGVAYLDAMVDDDYYGGGVCHWKLTSVAAGLKATGAPTETRFASFIDLQKVVDQEPVTRYFWKGGYPRSPETKLENSFDFGQADRSRMSPKFTNQDLFTLTLTSKAINP